MMSRGLTILMLSCGRPDVVVATLETQVPDRIKGKGRGYEGTVGDSGHTSLHL